MACWQFAFVLFLICALAMPLTGVSAVNNLLQVEWEAAYSQNDYGYFARCLAQTSDGGFLIGGTIGQYQPYQHG